SRDANSRLDFYNATQNNTLHASTHPYRATVEAMAAKVRGLGATLEIGSGGGAMQGIGDEYVALDYGFTALREYIDPKYQRVCGTAEALPFADRSIAFVLTIDALEHVPRVDAAFDEIDRVLKPGG